MVHSWQEVYKLIFWTLFTCLILTVMTGTYGCPQECACEDQIALCEYLTSTPGRFPEHVVNITISKSTIETLGPMELGHNIRHVFVQDTEITTLATNAFSHIQNLLSLSFSVVEIEVIEENAFSSMSIIKEIIFKRANIATIKSKAFSNISHVGNFSFIDCDIVEIESSSFHSVHNVGFIIFSQVVVKEMRQEAFRNVRRVKRVRLDNCTFKVMECNAIMELREATSKHRDSFTFVNSTLGCSCSSMKLFRYVQAHPESVSDTVKCFSASSRNFSGPILHVRSHYDELCSSGLRDSCEPHHSTGTPGSPTDTINTHAKTAVTTESNGAPEIPAVGGVVEIDESEVQEHSVTLATFSTVVHSAASTAKVQIAKSSTSVQTSTSNVNLQTAASNAVVQTATSEAVVQISHFNNVATSNKLQLSQVIVSVLVYFVIGLSI